MRWLSRRAILAGAAALAPASACAQRVYAMDVHRDPNCGCCHAWTALLQRTGRFAVSTIDAPDMGAVKQRLGVPLDLSSCHTGVVEGYVIEGHVPAQDVLRLVSEQPSEIIGLAVAGMPIGSPGMEVPGVAPEAYDVIALFRDGRRGVYARHPS